MKLHWLTGARTGLIGKKVKCDRVGARVFPGRGKGPVVAGAATMVNLITSGPWKPRETGSFRGIIVGFVIDMTMDP